MWIRWQACPWHDADGEIGGITLVGEDVTAEVEREQALHQSTQALARLHDVGWRLRLASSLREGLDEMLSATIELLGAAMGHVHILDTDGKIVTYFAQGQWEKGIPAYEHSLKLQPHWLTYSSLGTAYFYLKRYPEAVKAFEQAATLNPNDAITVGNLADGLRWSGDRDRAREMYVKAIALAYKDLQVNPKDSTTLAMVALYHAKTGNAASASDFIRKARAVDPKDAAISYYEAVVHALAGRQQPALTSLERALQGGYSAREAAEDPELQSLSKSEAFSHLLRRYSTPPR